jgi:DNA modification methylase
VTSPPYFGLRDYGTDGQIGLETTPDKFVQALVVVFREVRRVLRDDGTLWLNLGDSYAGSGKGAWANKDGGQKEVYIPDPDSPQSRMPKTFDGVKAKDLIGIPWRVAFALQADGWFLRQDIIWHKPNPMPESVQDRCTKAHEYIFLLSKSARYYFDSEAMKEPAVGAPSGNTLRKSRPTQQSMQLGDQCGSVPWAGGELRNRRSVWTVSTKPFKGAHFATFPPDLIEPCVLAGCPVGGTVLDPFNGAGTTGLVAARHGRAYVGIELNAEYVEITRRRLDGAGAPLSNTLPNTKGTNMSDTEQSLVNELHAGFTAAIETATAVHGDRNPADADEFDSFVDDQIMTFLTEHAAISERLGISYIGEVSVDTQVVDDASARSLAVRVAKAYGAAAPQRDIYEEAAKTIKSSIEAQRSLAVIVVASYIGRIEASGGIVDPLGLAEELEAEADVANEQGTEFGLWLSQNYVSPSQVRGAFEALAAEDAGWADRLVQEAAVAAANPKPAAPEAKKTRKPRTPKAEAAKAAPPPPPAAPGAPPPPPVARAAPAAPSPIVGGDAALLTACKDALPLTQQQIADLLGISRTQMNQIAFGKADTGLNDAQRDALADAVGKAIDALRAINDQIAAQS